MENQNQNDTLLKEFKDQINKPFNGAGSDNAVENETTPTPDPEPSNIGGAFTESEQSTGNTKSDYIAFDNIDTESNGTNSDKIPNDEFVHILLDAGLVIIIMDMVMPGLIFRMGKRFGYKINHKQLQLTQTEKDKLEPYIQKMIDSMNFKWLKPWQICLISIMGIYTGKIMKADIETNAS